MTNADPSALDALLCAAFEGEPGTGCRELRLSSPEADLLHAACPTALLSPMGPADEDGKTWYAVNFSYCQ